MMKMQGGLAPPPPAGDPQDPGATGGDGGANVSPEEQKLYDQFGNNCLVLIFGDGKDPRADKQRTAAVIKSLSASTHDFVGTLANVTAHIVVAAEVSAKKSSLDIPGDIVMAAGEDVLRELAQLASKTGIHTYDQRELEAAGLQAVDLYRQLGAQAGIVDENALKAQFGQMVQADKAGQLDQALPGASALAQHGAPDAGGAPPAPAPAGQQGG